ncbi:hypothetical protein HGRIS_003731 [Hohenbuehelia grisea]|uniref:Molybdopterin synthase sulfur carrier subunit n=1 Tax=Hohenbuehelia grisea TaxID=104357 RepID=A0ABR3JGE4_9AGAR
MARAATRSFIKWALSVDRVHDCDHIRHILQAPSNFMAVTHHFEITVLYFAAASTATQKTTEQIRIPDNGLRLSELGNLLISQYPETNLRDVLQSSQWSVDAEMVDDLDSVVLKGGEEVAVICPVSGG